MITFKVYGGTIPGRDHIGRGDVLVGKSNHDAFHWEADGENLIAIVADGNGSHPHSEIGAKLGVRLLAKEILALSKPERVERSEDVSKGRFYGEEALEIAAGNVVTKLRDIAQAMTREGDSVTKTMLDYMLFTLVGALITRTTTYIFSLGDGYYALNGALNELGPFEGNKPPYLAYRAMRTEFPDEVLKLRVCERLPTEAVETILLASDGLKDIIGKVGRKIPGMTRAVGELSVFWTEERFAKNPDALRRELSLMNREVRSVGADGTLVTESGLLQDDTTIVVIKRMGKEVWTHA